MADYFLADDDLDHEILYRRGKRPVWIDGKKHDTMGQAQKALGLDDEDMDELWFCAENGAMFQGHVVKMTEPRPPRERNQRRVRVTKDAHKFGEPLLSGHVKHRLGAYTGGKW